MGSTHISAFSSAGERFPDTEEVTGSIPVSRTTSNQSSIGERYADVAQLVAHNLAKVRVAGSSPVIRSNTPSPHREGFYFSVAHARSRTHRNVGAAFILYLVTRLSCQPGSASSALRSSVRTTAQFAVNSQDPRSVIAD